LSTTYKDGGISCLNALFFLSYVSVGKQKRNQGTKAMTELKRILMERDELTSKEADELISQARQMILDGEDAEEVLYEEFGLEPDYIFDLLDF
jgi:hypothetical protein